MAESTHRSLKERILDRDGMTATERKELRKSRVRIALTWMAGIYVFGGPWVVILKCGTDAKDLFMSVLPVATGIVAFWFAERARPRDGSPSDKPKKE